DHRRSRRRWFGGRRAHDFGGRDVQQLFQRDPPVNDRRKNRDQQKQDEASPRPKTNFFHARYFFIQATIATMRPITLKTDIRPAGIIFQVLKNFGTNCPAKRSETTKAVASPAARC